MKNHLADASEMDFGGNFGGEIPEFHSEADQIPVQRRFLQARRIREPSFQAVTQADCHGSEQRVAVR